MPDLATVIPAEGGARAAAILMMLLEEAEAADVLGRLEPDEVKQLGATMYEIADVSEGSVNSVLDLFVAQARERTTIGFEADQQIRGMMERALGAERADKVLARVMPPQKFGSLEALKWMDARSIAQLVEHEHPQFAALTLAHLDPAAAASVLELLDEGQQAEIVYRIATLRPVGAMAVESLEQLLLRQTGGAGGATSRRGGPSEAAAIVNNTRTPVEQRIIRTLQKLDKGLARTIEDEMFVFENLLDLDDKSLGAVLRTVEADRLVLALKGADDRIRDRFFGCMSQRAAQSIQDELADRGPTRLSDVQDAQKTILAAARRLADAGEIMLGAKGDDYV
ncbi:flagellar motor switch protein FliG [Sphingomonas gilva]|uniref:Flagellar motor switch protein FliG n=1 Tax=Sphingomonas gilva TaxID=2305907 RepID=A0A396RSV9_9SPHN|nr:flagellar motor switch protein FliG [Sphingomonas gilva]RHW18462.1 flagellar motor switch protein FliG [Sphingomonas gilva]